MASFSYGNGEPVEVDQENVAQFETAGWTRLDQVEDEKPKKSDK